MEAPKIPPKTARHPAMFLAWGIVVCAWTSAAVFLSGAGDMDAVPRSERATQAAHGGTDPVDDDFERRPSAGPTSPDDDEKRRLASLEEAKLEARRTIHSVAQLSAFLDQLEARAVAHGHV